MTRQKTVSPEKHLHRADPVLGEVIDRVVGRGGVLPSLPPDPRLAADPLMPTDCYGVLIRAIAGQNISGYAARAIYRKLTERFGGRVPTPREILDEDPDALRVAAGLSHAKTLSLRSLAERILSGDLQLGRLHDLPDEDVVSQLSAVKGIGTWTADMFLIWHLHRPDVLPVGDLELRRVVGRVYGLPGPPRPADLRPVAEPWRPYRTLACLFLWQEAEAPSRV
ncbi:DNA-3-methyladenine glycosylase family protein [Actinacidiphila acidipaludis]|uniref:DNA-3-methyladenine glycosylase II n=1 Tax=Actinacidiphila acidipaludis TaxID=2873382 RepID=A0ABS7Q7E3_9ACTN|nr:DNA-3-methyladenine glycosylase 2 family protein [Streptomyces acidipaludis]MBY8879080.1 DNA-3-methyladenine glycosylase 2 family protein [Streptomyces acidipaludis]